jgi:hypothetical protein
MNSSFHLNAIKFNLFGVLTGLNMVVIKSFISAMQMS